jgi:hypothetical protein
MASNAVAPIVLALLYQALSPSPGSPASEYQRAETVRPCRAREEQSAAPEAVGGSTVLLVVASGLLCSPVLHLLCALPDCLLLTAWPRLPPQTAPRTHRQRVAARFAPQACLALTGCVSLLAFLAYAPLPALIPKPLPPAPGLEDESLEKYLDMSVKDFTNLDLTTRLAVNARLVEKGRTPIDAHWSTYNEDRGDNDRLKVRGRAQITIEALKTWIVKQLTSQENFARLAKQVKEQRAATRARYNMEAERQTMGDWIGGYLDDAGYDDWMEHPDLYKMMIMDAFPPIDAIDGELTDLDTQPQLEAFLLKRLKVLDMHSGIIKEQLREEADALGTFSKVFSITR